jgi:predicted outer membrane repeat protein
MCLYCVLFNHMSLVNQFLHVRSEWTEPLNFHCLRNPIFSRTNKLITDTVQNHKIAGKISKGKDKFWGFLTFGENGAVSSRRGKSETRKYDYKIDVLFKYNYSSKKNGSAFYCHAVTLINNFAVKGRYYITGNAKNMLKPFKSQWLIYAPPALTRNSLPCAFSAFTSYAFFCYRTLNNNSFLLHSINLLVFEMRTEVASVWRDHNEICALLGYYAASCGNCIPIFRDNVSVSSSGVKSPRMFKYCLDYCRADVDTLLMAASGWASRYRGEEE